MTDFPTTHSDLLDAQIATLATIDDDGLPQLTEVWFIHDDGELRFSLNGERFKTANLKARSACSVPIVDLTNPYRYLEVRGHARVEEDSGGALAAKVGKKYDADLTAYDQPGDVRYAVTIEPSKIHPVDMGG
jgi:PPOX class probable F420-dependent enzyme